MLLSFLHTVLSCSFSGRATALVVCLTTMSTKQPSQSKEVLIALDDEDANEANNEQEVREVKRRKTKELDQQQLRYLHSFFEGKKDSTVLFEFPFAKPDVMESLVDSLTHCTVPASNNTAKSDSQGVLTFKLKAAKSLCPRMYYNDVTMDFWGRW